MSSGEPEGKGFEECVDCGETVFPMFGGQSGKVKCLECAGDGAAG